MYLGPVVPGRSSVSFAVGSDGYMGTAFSTAERIKGTNIIYSVSASWEKGNSYYSGQDYEMSSISPSLSWSNGTTSLFLAVNISELNLDTNSVSRKVRPRVDTGTRMSRMPLTRDRNRTLEYESINLGLSQRSGERGYIFLNVGEDMFGNDNLGIGLSHRIWDRSSGSYR